MQSNPGKGRKRARRILLCAGGGIIAYSLPRIILHLIHHFADDVQVVLSRAAAKMVTPYALEVASRNRVFVEMDDTGDGVYVPHIELGRNIDLVVVFPATVNIMSKVANGITDELITALIIATEAPVLFLPEGNPAMMHHPAVQRNIERLRADGYVILPQIPGPEVATREGMERLGENFPIPSLLLQMSAALADPESGGMARRNSRKD
jgi:phosphopantothenoylcysteine synthetase/decarboxylase